MSGEYQLLPPLSAAEYAALKADISEHGVLVPVELDARGAILDGHHRVRAWQELRAEGMRLEPYPRLIRSGLTEAEKRGRVLALNLYRRHLVPNQRAAVLARIKDELQWSNRRIADLAGVSEGTVRNDLAATAQDYAVDPAARVVGKDGKSRPAKRKKRTVVTARSDGEQQRALEALARLPEDAQPEGLVTTGDVAKAARPYRPLPERRPVAEPDRLPARLAVADVLALPLDSESVDLIVTSPPYGLAKEYVGSAGVDSSEAWLRLMSGAVRALFRVATAGGRLALNVPLDTSRSDAVGFRGSRPTYALALALALEAGWTHRFTIVWNEGTVTHSTGRGSQDSAAAPHVIAPVEMIAVFAKLDWEDVRECEHPAHWADMGFDPAEFVAAGGFPDESRRPQRQGYPACTVRRTAEWKRRSEQPSDLTHAAWLEWTNGLWTFPGEARAWESHPAAFPEELPRRLITLLSFPGDVVLDPFMGSGTTPLVARRLGRVAIGFDASAAYVEAAQRRFAAEFPA